MDGRIQARGSGGRSPPKENPRAGGRENAAAEWGAGPNPRNPPSILRRPNPPLPDPASPSKGGSAACHPPLPPTPPTPYPTPMPTRTRPTTPRIHPTIRRSYEGRACPGEGRGTSLPVKGESRGGIPLLLGRRAALGDVPPVSKNRLGVAGRESLGGSAAGRVGPTDVAMPAQVSPWRLPPQGVGAEPAPAKAGGLPCALFPFVGFGPYFTEALRLRSARALADTTCPPFSTVSTPPSGALGPPSRPCLADTVRFPLSTCPSRLNPKLRRAAPGTELAGKNAQHHSKQIRPELTGGGRHGLP